MLALKINNVKTFMTQLLIGDTFDAFPLAEASITTFNTFTIDGRVNKEFFDTDTQDILTQNAVILFPLEKNKTFLPQYYPRETASAAVSDHFSACAISAFRNPENRRTGTGCQYVQQFFPEYPVQKTKCFSALRELPVRLL